MRRYYKIRDLAPVTIERSDGFDVAASQYRRHDRSVAVLSVRSSTDELRDALVSSLRGGVRGRSTRHGGRRPVPDDPVGGPPDRRRARRTARRRASTRPACRRRSVASPSSPSTPIRPWPPFRSRSAVPTRTAEARTGCRAANTADRAAVRRGPQVPWPPSDDLQTAAHVAPVELRDLPTPIDRRRLRLRLRRQGEPGRPPARRRCRDSRADPAARRARSGGRHPGGRARPRRLSRRHPQRPSRRPETGAARLEPGDAVHLAGRRPPVRRDQRHRPAADSTHRRARTRAGRRQRHDCSCPASDRTRRRRDAPRLRTGARAHRAHHRTAGGADAAARRLHPQAHPDPPPRARPSLRVGPHARRTGRFVRRARPRRPGSARPRRAQAGTEPRRRRRRRRDDSARRLPGRDHAGRRARRPDRAMGAIAEAECVRIIAAIDLAAAMDVPIEWFALSAGAKIAMDSGSENLDWVARVLRRLVEHTQAGGGPAGGAAGGVARSTSSSPGSTSAPSPTGTPSRRC